MKSRYGYVDEKGRVIIEPQYELAYDFSEGLGLVRINSRFGFIDSIGQIVIPPKYSLAISFSEGLAPVAIGRYPGKWGYIDKSGKIVIALQFDGAEPFINDVAKVGFEYDCKHCFDGLPPTSYLKTIKYIDRTRKYVESRPK